jgi:hypothetical protein
MGSVIVATSAAFLLAGCYTGSVNMRPTVSINPQAEPIYRGEPLTFSATWSDVNGDAVTLQWARQDVACPIDIFDEAYWPTSGEWQPGPSLSVDGTDTAATFCVWVKAVDSHGAAGIDARQYAREDRAPNARIVLLSPADATAFPLHTEFQLEASTGDASSGTFTFSWDVISSPDPKLDVSNCMTGPTCTFQGNASGEYDVQLSASDGTTTVVVPKSLRVLPGPPPVAVLELVSPTDPGPYKLGTTFRISGALSTGGDSTHPLGFDMVLNHDGAPQSIATLGDCADAPAPGVQCFTADAAGTYAVQLTVSNDTTSPPTTLMPLLQVLHDQPPCIGLTSPPITASPVIASASETTRFEVMTVDDDLSPYPTPVIADPVAAALFSPTHFRWSSSPDGGASFQTVGTLPVYSILPDPSEATKQLKLRLEITDDDTQRSANEFSSCTDDKCFTTEGCFQRVTWTVEFNR